VTGYESIAEADEGLLLGGGLVVRLVIFAFLGGFWEYLHRSESDRFKVFQLGLIGPAILVGIVQGNLSKVEVKADGVAAMRLPALVAPAYAQAQPSPQAPQPDSLDLLIRGILGTSVVKK
jgi:hypothetical protein